MNKPKVSIIMGVYNITNNFEQVEIAIDSMLKQTFDNFEFIICDDGSSDNSFNQIMMLSKKDNRIKVIKNNKNLGLAATLNKCLKVCKGEYIARMDSDDISDTRRIDEQVKFLDNNLDFSIVGCNAELFDNNGIWGELKHLEYPQKQDFLFGSRFIHPTIMVRKEVYEQVNGYRVSKETVRGQDYDFFMRVYSLGYKGYNIQKKLFKYREDENAYKKRTYKNRINEAIVRYKGFKQLGLLPRGCVFIVKPLIVGLIPKKILRRLKRR